jgi:hypothetical protein
MIKWEIDDSDTVWLISDLRCHLSSPNSIFRSSHGETNKRSSRDCEKVISPAATQLPTRILLKATISSFLFTPTLTRPVPPISSVHLKQ